MDIAAAKIIILFEYIVERRGERRTSEKDFEDDELNMQRAKKKEEVGLRYSTFLDYHNCPYFGIFIFLDNVAWENFQVGKRGTKKLLE